MLKVTGPRDPKYRAIIYQLPDKGWAVEIRNNWGAVAKRTYTRWRFAYQWAFNEVRVYNGGHW